MRSLVFNTGNETKFINAQQVCKQYGLDVVQQNYEIDEIQGEDPEKIAIDKAKKAFKQCNRPVVITDDSWAFLGLNGFPGVYMHSMNAWLTTDDFLRLTLPLNDRRAVVTQYLVYATSKGCKVFKDQNEGTLLKEIRGTSIHPSLTIIAMPGDDGLSIAEAYSQGVDRTRRETTKIWHEFAKWYSEPPT